MVAVPLLTQKINTRPLQLKPVAAAKASVCCRGLTNSILETCRVLASGSQSQDATGLAGACDLWLPRTARQEE